MEVTQKSHDTLGDLADAPLPITLNGTEYTLHKLKWSDLATVQQWLRGKAQDLFYETSRMVPLSEEARAIASHKNVTKPYTNLELLNDQDSRPRLLYLSVRRGGYKGEYKAFLDELDIQIMERMVSILFWITGIKPPPGDESSDPTTTTTAPSENATGEQT